MKTLLTAADIADRLGVSASRVKQLTKQAGFPQPYAMSPPTEKRTGIRLWRPEDIDRWAQIDRASGRPRQSVSSY
jgi:predicted DNA-binding transcriptional regulator AlpA